MLDHQSRASLAAHIPLVRSSVLFPLLALNAQPCFAAQEITVLPLGPELDVCTGDGHQNTIRVDMAADGSYVAVWEGPGVDGIDVYARIYDPYGNELGPKILVNTSTVAGQHTPSVAVRADGEFVVVWTDNTSSGNHEVMAQLFDASGATIGSEFQVNDGTTGHQAGARVDCTDDGTIVVTWKSVSGAQGIYARLFDWNGNPFTTVDITVDPAGGDPSVSINPDESFVVTWTGSDGDGTGVRARLYDSSWTPGSAFLVNANLVDDQFQPHVATDDVGEFVVVWISKTGASGTGALGVVRRSFDAVGTPYSGDVLVAEPGNSISEPGVGRMGAGPFLVSWVDSGAGTADILAEAFRSDGTTTGGPFVVNETTTGAQVRPDVGLNDSGSWVITWGSDAVDAGDVHARQLDCPLGHRYCTAKTDSCGCEPAIGFSGLPTLTWNDDYVLTAEPVAGQALGFLIWGLDPNPPLPGVIGPSPLGGRYCVFGPSPTPVQSSGGTAGSCDGSFNFKFTQVMLASLGQGTSVYAQFVYDDPSTGEPGSSDALEFCVRD